jgi:hypothetical protein
VVHGAPCRFSDPARFSLAHGGKDGHPYPVPVRVYDETLSVLRRAVDRARLGEDDRLAALKRLDAEARRLEATARGPSFERFAADERAASRAYGGKTVFDSSSPRPSPPALAGGGGGSRRTAPTTPTSTATPTATPRPAQLSLRLDRR